MNFVWVIKASTNSLFSHFLIQLKMSSIKLPWTLSLKITLFEFIVNACRRSNGTVNRPLCNFFDRIAPTSKTPQNGVATSDVAVDSSRNLWFRLFTPTTIPKGGDELGSLPIIIYFHGGGFAFLSAGSIVYDEWCRRVARELQAVVVSVNYRLAPEHQFPCQYEDGMDALKFLDNNLEELPINVNPKWCFLAGDSAGGNLAHHVAVKAGEYNFTNLKMLGLISLQPFFGGEERTESEIKNDRNPLLSLDFTDWYWKVFLPNGSNRDHPAANVFGPKSSADVIPDTFPATLLFVGGLDLLKDWQMKYYEGLKKAGKEVYLVEDPTAFHCSFMYKEFPEYNLFVKEIEDFMLKQMKGTINN